MSPEEVRAWENMARDGTLSRFSMFTTDESGYLAALRARMAELN